MAYVPVREREFLTTAQPPTRDPSPLTATTSTDEPQNIPQPRARLQGKDIVRAGDQEVVGEVEEERPRHRREEQRGEKEQKELRP